MKVLVLGGGVIGVASAYYLARAGHEVEVVDRQWTFHGRRAARRALPMPSLQGGWQLRNGISHGTRRGCGCWWVRPCYEREHGNRGKAGGLRAR